MRPEGEPQAPGPGASTPEPGGESESGGRQPGGVSESVGRQPGGVSIVAKLRPFLPYATLAWAIGSALLMNRKPERAWLVAVAVGVGWLFLAGAVLLQRRPTAHVHGRLVRYSATAGTQGLMQMTLFFVLPFYWLSAAPILAHRVFLGVLGTICALTLWDPLFQRLFARPYFALPLMATTSFVGLLAALPFLGLSHATSLWTATAVTAAGVPLVALATAPPEGRRRALVVALVVASLLPLSVYKGAVRWVPPAPLRLMDGGLGADVDRKARVLIGVATEFETPPEQLYCFTAIQAPLGLHEQVFHDWSRDGNAVFRATLDVGGNRVGAWRTWSYITPHGAGRYQCDVVTSTGQTLGRMSASINERAEGASRAGD